MTQSPGSTRDAVIAALQEAAGVLDHPEIAPRLLKGGDVPFDEIEIDSLGVFEVIMHLEEEFGIELDSDEVSGQASVQALVAYLDERRSSLAG